MFDVQKRDGEIDDFNLVKIRAAIEKAFKATKKEYTDEIIELLSLRVTADFQPKIENGLIHVEDVQDSVAASPDFTLFSSFLAFPRPEATATFTSMPATL